MPNNFVSAYSDPAYSLTVGGFVYKFTASVGTVGAVGTPCLLPKDCTAPGECCVIATSKAMEIVGAAP